MEKTELSNLRPEVIAKLRSLLVYADDEHRHKNERALDDADNPCPPIEDSRWQQVSFVSGIFGRFMWPKVKTATERDALWSSIRWSVWFEHLFQPKLVSQRFSGLLNAFSNSITADKTWLSAAVGDLERLVPILSRFDLVKLQGVLSRFGEGQFGPEISGKIEQRLSVLPARREPTQKVPASLPRPKEPADPAHTKVFEAFEKLWSFLDKKQENQNRNRISSAAQNINEIPRLEFLARVICRNVIWRITNSETNVSNEQLEAAIFLADFASKFAKGWSEFEARRCLLLLRGLLGMRHHSLDPEAFGSELDALTRQEKSESIESTWSDLAALVRRHLFDRRVSLGYSDRVEAEAWVRVFAARVEKLDTAVREAFLEEAEAHSLTGSLSLEILKQGKSVVKDTNQLPSGPLAFLDADRRVAFEDNLRSGRLAEVRASLQGARKALFSALSRALADDSYQKLKCPRRPLYDRKRLFEGARRLIMSDSREDRKKGLGIFEAIERDTNHPDYTRFAEEWVLFARAQAFGPVRVVKQWEDDRKGNPSWEEIWNLAVFYLQTGSPERALEVLETGMEDLRAPISHLKFALYASIQVLEQAPKVSGEESVQKARGFLATYLPMLPLPECYLVWLLIIEDAALDIDVLKQAEVLGIFQELVDSPVELLDPEEQNGDAKIERFRERLQQLNLEKTWRLWINDLAERNYAWHRPWQWLSEASERAGDLSRAEVALNHIVHVALNRAQKPPRGGGSEKSDVSPLRSVRTSLIHLFQFYRRNAMNKSAEATFRSYFRQVRQLWDASDPSNNLLIGLTRTYLNELPDESVGKISATANGITAIWTNLYPDLASVKDLAALMKLRPRIEAAIQTLPTGQKVVRERADYIRQTFVELAGVEERQWRLEEVQPELARLNRSIKIADDYVEQESVLRPMKALVAAIQRSFEEIARRLRAIPMPEVESSPLGGVADDMVETSVVVRLRNPGPGDMQNLRVTCSDSGVIGSHGEIRLEYLGEGAEEIAAIPVTVRPPADRSMTACTVRIEYDWGIMRSLTQPRPLNVPWFSFRNYVQDHSIQGYEIPVPYVFDAIDFDRHDGRLFQGRSEELNLIRMTMLRNQNPGSPLYFHGIRKVGKTSLLRRLQMLLRQEAFVALLVDLTGIDPAEQGLAGVINSFSSKLSAGARTAGMNGDLLPPVGTDDQNPLLAFEHFLESFTGLGNGRPVVLLLDEFHNLVSELTTPVLDLIRHFHQRDAVWFILSGWLRPEPLRESCPRTNLFPLMHRPVDFLSADEVGRCLREPVGDFGVDIPEITSRRVFEMTAGNPFHVAKIAYGGIEILNREHRTVLGSAEVTRIAAELARDAGNFTSSSFSPWILTPEERRTAIAFAKGVDGPSGLVTVNSALSQFGADVVQALEQKYILELVSGRGLRIRSPMLAMFLRDRIIDTEPLPPPQVDKSRKVGVFVDFENVYGALREGMSPTNVGRALLKYASKFGRVVCRWACAHPANLKDPTGVRLGLEQAGFDVRFPRQELQGVPPKKNAADFLLLECITDERSHSQPDIFMLVTGDKDYYERTSTLLESGYAVRIVSNVESTAKVYSALEEQRRLQAQAMGRTDSDFYLDDLTTVIAEGERAD